MAEGRRKKGSGGGSSEGGGGGWEVTYTGFILIMLCFFIMLCSFATMEETKVMQFVKSFSRAVNILTGGLKFVSGSEVLNVSSDIVDKKSDIAKLMKKLEEAAAEAGFGRGEMTIKKTSEGVVMRLSERILFERGVAVISDPAKPLLAKVASIASSSGVNIRIEGHTCDLPVRGGRFQSNWELSAARAVNVLRFFTEVATIKEDIISAVGFGEYHPIYPNDSEENRAKNRRVEIVFSVEE